MATKAQLTHREIEVLRCLAEGKTNAQIAAQLGIVESTVRTHIQALKVLTGSKSYVHLALYAIREGIVPARGQR